MSKVGDVMWEAPRGTRQRETRNDERRSSKFDPHSWDSGSGAAPRAQFTTHPTRVRPAGANTLQTLLPDAGSVLAERRRGTWFGEISGASLCSMPPGEQRLTRSYARLDFAEDTRGAEMLATNHEQFA